MTILRCSALPRAFACPPSVVDGDTIDIENGDGGNSGSAAHEAMDAITDDGIADLEAIAARWGADRDELGRLAWYGRRAWEQLAPSFTGEIRKEAALRLETPEFTLSGHVDLMTAPAPIVHGLDWKFGWLDGDYYPQLAGYASCLLLGNPVIQEVILSIVWARDQELETYRFNRERCRAFIRSIGPRIIERAAGGYRTGPQCTYCSRSHGCEAMQARARQDVAIFGNVALQGQIERGLQDIPPAEIVSMVRRGKVVVTAYEAFREAVRRLVEAHGPLDAGDGHVLRIAEENGRREIDTERAFNILKEEFTPGEMNQIFSARPSVMDEIAAKKAGRGNGAAAKRALQDRLVAAGAIDQKPVRKLVERRKPKGEP